MSPPYINSFYRIWFTNVDPLVLLGTVITCIVSPATILETVLPPSIEPFSALSHGPLLHQSAALYGFMMIIFAWLLRASPDRNVWRIVQWATLSVDIGLLVTMYAMLKQQGRLELKDWLSGDYANFGFTSLVAVIRIAFLLEIGGDGSVGAKKVR